MSRNYNAKYDEHDVNGRDVIEAGYITNGYDKGPAFSDQKKDSDHAVDHGKNSIVSGLDKTGPAYNK